jgi:hypothetical protein
VKSPWATRLVILCQTKRQYRKARRILFNTLAALKLSLSPRKSWMGPLTKSFHFLGVRFSVATPEAKTQQRTTIHPRSCTRALDKVKALRLNAVNPATIQRSLLGWARWWKNTVGPLNIQTLLLAWVHHARERDPSLVWFGTGILLLFLNAPCANLTELTG